jgi:predicted enzyme related to lactoylglutathione lyase
MAAQGWRDYIGVPSISKCVEAAKAGGATSGLEPMEVPASIHIIIGNDPQGAELAPASEL